MTTMISNVTPNWNALAKYVHDEIGYAIQEEKYYLLESHVEPIMSANSFKSVEALVANCRLDIALRQEVINAVTINETYFFRDVNIWKDLEERILPELINEVKYSKKLRILSCACSKGQEVYTLAIVIDRLRPLFGEVTVEILGTDIDTTVLKQASSGLYSHFELSRGLDDKDKNRYFTQVGNNQFQVSDDLRNLVEFQQWNLAEPLSVRQRFDLILCRNVMIYFDVEQKAKVFENLTKLMNNYGYLGIGGSESILNVTDKWSQRRIGTSVFLQKVY